MRLGATSKAEVVQAGATSHLTERPHVDGTVILSVFKSASHKTFKAEVVQEGGGIAPN